MTTFFKTIEKRHSVRSFLDKPVEKSKIQKMLNVSMASPFAKGLQSYRIYIVEDNKKKEKDSNTRISHNG
jgi:nitroreductase